MSRLGAIDRALVAIAVAAAALWLAATAAGTAAGALLAAKGAVLPLLALVAWRRRREIAGGAALAVALLLHGAGDLLLELAFLAGVGAFFAGHLVYIALFWRHRRAVDDLGGGAKLAIGMLALTGALFLALFGARLGGALAIAVPLYVAALLTMAASALAAGRGQPLVGAGALLFVASDGLLAVELFLGGAGGGRLLVWPLYVAAQLAMALGWIRAGKTGDSLRFSFNGR